MIVLSYGMTKSGSTLAFELCKAVLEQRGYEQRHLPDDVVTEGHHINFLADVTVANLEKLVAEVAPSEIIAIKIHAPVGLAEVKFHAAGRGSRPPNQGPRQLSVTPGKSASR